MNEEYTSVSTTANIIQSVMDVLTRLNEEYVTVPHDPQELTNDIQAMAAKHLGGVRVN